MLPPYKGELVTEARESVRLAAYPSVCLSVCLSVLYAPLSL